MKLVKKMALGLTLVSSVFAAAGCGSGPQGAKDRLNIVYYPGGYGTEYLVKFVTEFCAQYKGKDVSEIKEGVDYILEADTEVPTAPDAHVKFEDDACDLIIGGNPNTTHIEQGLIEPIDDIFESEVTVTLDDGSQGKKKIKDFIMNESYVQFERQQLYGQGDKHIYCLPYTIIPISLIYNETILKNTDHVNSSGEVAEERLSNGKWNAAPATYEELIAYFKDIESYNSSNGKEITPFGWSLGNVNWFESFYLNWWSETQGLTKSNFEGQGSFYDFWNRENYKGFEQTGLQVAFQKVKDLIYDSTGNYQYTYKNTTPALISGTLCQSDFAQGNSGISMSGDFFEKEYGEDIARSGNTFKMMAMPTISNNLVVDDGNGGTRAMNKLYCNMDASAYIPTYAKNKDMAKAFLKYISEEKQIVTFTEMTGCLKPFNCNVKKLSSKTDWTPFQQSVLDLYYNADELLIKFPKGKSGDDICPVFQYQTGLKNSFLVGIAYADVVNYLKKHTPQEILVTDIYENGSKLRDSCLSSAKEAYTKAYIGYNSIYKSWYQRHPGTMVE